MKTCSPKSPRACSCAICASLTPNRPTPTTICSIWSTITASPIAYFAWTPRRTGTEIVRSVVPFILVALAGFALLAGLVFRYMRHTAAAIAEGEDRLRHQALHDPLCGLPNRRYFGQRLEAVIDQVRHGGPQAAVFYIDLDHFKDVNDTLGHPVGDDLIRSVTNRLTRTLRGHDLVARLGGDEFAVIAAAAPDHDVAADHRGADDLVIVRALFDRRPHHRHRRQHRNRGDRSPHRRRRADIMRYADMALYRAKNEGRNRACIYDCGHGRRPLAPQAPGERSARRDRER